MRVLSQTRWGLQQRLVLVEVGEGEARCRLLLGVTAQQVSVLHQLPAGPADAHPAVGAPPVVRPSGACSRAGAAPGRCSPPAKAIMQAEPSKPLLARTVRLALPPCCPRCWPPRRSWANTPATPGGLPIVLGQGSGGSTYSVPVQTLLILTSLSFLPAMLSPG